MVSFLRGALNAARAHGKVDYMIIDFPHLHRVRALSLAAATATVVLAAPQAASAAGAPGALPADIAQLSSGSSQFVPPRLTLPNELYAAADSFGITLPDFLKPASNAFPSQRAALDAATEDHLVNQGHYSDARAEGYAQEWADQAARGEVLFSGTVGRGTTHLAEGNGNIYKLTASEASERVAWLNRDVPVAISPQAKGFGVATATDGSVIYVAEFFFN